MTPYLRQLRFECRSIVASDSRLAMMHRPCIWWEQYKAIRYYKRPANHCVVGKRTEFVLDGFQGSANSFAARAFLLSQTRPVLFAHHLHSPAQIIKAVEAEIPTVLTIREPAGAVLSLVSRWPYVSIKQALRAWLRFYNKVAPYAGGCVVSPFRQTTERFDEVIRTVNRRFNTSFDLLDYSEENMRILRDPKKLVSEKAVRRRQLKSQRARELQNDQYGALLGRAESVYRTFEGYAMDGP
jgi:hypothetical protein